MIEMAVLFLEVDLPLYFKKWIAAVSDPDQFLRPAFSPTDGQFDDALKFYLVVMAFSVVIYGLVAFFAESRSFAIRAQMLASGLLNLASLFLFAAVLHFPMWLMGGKATFTGTLLSNIYSGGVYTPLLAIAQWIFVAGMAPHWRPYALNPTMAKAVAPNAIITDPDTDKVTYVTGSLIMLCLIGWTIYATIQSVSLVHDLSGWRFVVALILWVVILIPVTKVFRRAVSILYPPIEDILPTLEQSSDLDYPRLTQSPNVLRLPSPPQ